MLFIRFMPLSKEILIIPGANIVFICFLKPTRKPVLKKNQSIKNNFQKIFENLFYLMRDIIFPIVYKMAKPITLPPNNIIVD